MRVKIIGGSEEQIVHARKLCKFFAEKYFTKELSASLKLKIYHEPAVGEDMGDCSHDLSDPDELTYVINLYMRKNINLVTYIRVLAHELVHLKQYALKELVYLVSTNNKFVRYNGKRYIYEMDYWDRPWEIEAHGREKGILVNYCTLAKIEHILTNHF